ncbi:MAG: hypothetical protein WD431_24820 [Cyclobacteriaceae bacterium]
MDRKYKTIDFQKIEDMVEGDAEFRKQLLEAIIVAVRELEITYIKGIDGENLDWIKQARHKIKPTMGLFDLQNLAIILGQGKRMISENGFSKDLEHHKKEFLMATNEILEEVNQNI